MYPTARLAVAPYQVALPSGRLLNGKEWARNFKEALTPQLMVW
jgi:hypothetical protein